MDIRPQERALLLGLWKPPRRERRLAPVDIRPQERRLLVPLHPTRPPDATGPPSPSHFSPALHLQSLRALNSSAAELLLRVQHLFPCGTDPQYSQPLPLDAEALLSSFLPAGAAVADAPLEVTLDGAQPV